MTPVVPADRRPGFTPALLAASCIALAFMLTTPGFVEGMMSDWGASEQQIGNIVTADYAGTAIGSLLLCFVLGDRRVRSTIQLSALLLVIGNGITTIHYKYFPIELARLISGIGGGILGGVAMRYLSMSADSARNMTWMIVVQTLFAIFMLTIGLPALATAGGPERQFEAYALAGLLCFPIANFFAKEERSAIAAFASTPLTTRAPKNIRAWTLMAAMFMQYVGVGIVWTFLANRGTSTGLSPGDAQKFIGLHNIGGIAVCFIGPVLARRHGIAKIAIASLFCACISIWLLAYATTPLMFHFGTFGFIVSWCMAISMLLSWIPVFDSVGRYVMLTPSVLCIGTSVGAALGGWVAEHSALRPAFMAASVATAIAALLTLALEFPAQKSSRRSEQSS